MPREKKQAGTFIVLSLKHTHRRHKAITLWRSDDSGYCWMLSSAGHYEEARVLEHLGHYNSGCSNIAVSIELVERISCEVEYDTKEFGVCLPNNADTWAQLLASVVRPTDYEPKPEYRGCRYSENSMWMKRKRCEHVNQAMRIIADHGRRFFYSQAVNRYASMEIDARGKVWFIDDYSGKRIFTHETVWGGRWRGFSHGGTLKDLIKEFRDYICTGKQLHPGYLGPERFDDSNIWGYDQEDMRAVREQAGALPVFRQPLAAAA
ncbi:hypothetical protein PS938_02521 [Pseudomonas fluorescens]|uniref:Uncharacterized protein n=1 Tax=Pseudomonas fluorescens TaxID=294 RepID=A0A5E7TTA4_PSEFL|nr:hypothetical protein [Pseudomonas fluorescens]VVQ01475.1 hypothetical protein PS938_02521 [Pseudomonas fluorescens]